MAATSAAASRGVQDVEVHDAGDAGQHARRHGHDPLLAYADVLVCDFTPLHAEQDDAQRDHSAEQRREESPADAGDAFGAVPADE
jgi:hypothetical protein